MFERDAGFRQLRIVRQKPALNCESRCLDFADAGATIKLPRAWVTLLQQHDRTRISLTARHPGLPWLISY